MQRPKRIFIIGSFKDESPQTIRIERRHWIKGFIRLGHDVQRFSYRNIMLQSSWIKSKKFAKRFAKKGTDKTLLEQVKSYHPDIVLFLNVKDLDHNTIAAMREVIPKTVFVGRDNEPFPEKIPGRLETSRQMDIVVAANAGKWLKSYKKAGIPVCAFIPNPCDPDIQRPYEVEDKWKSDIIFTGKVEHTNIDRDVDRQDLLVRLSKMPNAKLYGCFGNPKINGIEVFYAISGAKIALSINIANNVRLYHSDRLVNCLACGTFTLAKKVPDSDLLFQDGVHLKYFDNADEFFELADWYLHHEKERERIAKAGMERAHKEFNCEKIAQYVLDVVEKGSYDAPWATIL
ncbi:glycosyltransferase [Planctomycetota bacterium]